MGDGALPFLLRHSRCSAHKSTNTAMERASGTKSVLRPAKPSSVESAILIAVARIIATTQGRTPPRTALTPAYFIRFCSTDATRLGAGKVLFNTSIGPGFDSAALEQWLALPGTHFFCDTRAAAGPVGEGFFERENVHCANVSAGRTKQAFVLLSQKVLANIRTALGE